MKPGKRLIFTATSGRSGTAYLANLLSSLPDATVFHEPNPGFQEVLPGARSDPRAASGFLRDIKLPHIMAQSGSNYIETSHYFCKGFVEPMLDMKMVPDLIVLTREARSVAKSWFLLGASLQMFREGKRSRRMIGPNEKNFLPVSEWEEWHDYQYCYWYALESQRRSAHYASHIAAQGGKVIHLELNTLVEGAGFKQLLDWLEAGTKDIARYMAHHARTPVTNAAGTAKTQHNREQILTELALDALESKIHHQCGVLADEK